MKNTDNENVIINFEYKSQLVTIKTNPFKKLAEIKKMAIKKINILNNINLTQEELICNYLGRNLNEYEQQKICELFSNREKISIKLVSPKNNLTIDLGNNLPNNVSFTPNASPMRKNYFTNFFKNTKVFSSGFNSIGRIKKDKNSVMYQLFTERLKNKNYLLPMININNSRNNSTSLNKEIKSEDDDYYYISSKKEHYNNINEIGIICGKCNENYINEYCRTCNEFICTDCKDHNDHKNHLSIHLIGADLNDNINLYANLVQTDIEETINSNNKLIINNDKIFDIIDQKILIGKNEVLIHKLENLIKMYQNIIDILRNNYIKDNKIKINGLIENFENGATNINEEITQLLNNINNQNRKKFDFNELKSYFDKINNNEVKLSELNQELIKFHLNNEINYKINFIYSKINKIIDDAVDIKNLFNLEPKYYNELIKIINFDQNRFNKKYKTNKFLDFNFSEENSINEENKNTNNNNNKEKEKNEKITNEKRKKTTIKK